jgi:CheY-like chemotaxis protein
MTETFDNRRLLLVDDHRPIHDDFRSILNNRGVASERLGELESTFFGEAVLPSVLLPKYEMESAFQGQEALSKVEASLKAGHPYALGFIDVRMPPGWDGIETIQHIWNLDTEMQFVICTAYADYTWEEIFKRFGNTERVVFLRKPFDQTEVRQLACTLTAKWKYSAIARLRSQELYTLVRKRTEELTLTVIELGAALQKVQTLSGLVPICPSCRKVRDDQGFWKRVEAYISERTKACFIQEVCPICAKTLPPEIAGTEAQRECSTLPTTE